MPDRKRFINVRGGYSDTSGIAPCNTEMQLYQFDKRTRMMISNKTFDILKNVFQNPEKMFMMREADSAFCEDVISNVFIEPVFNFDLKDRRKKSNPFNYLWEEE